MTKFTAEDLRWFVGKMELAVRLTKETGKEHGFTVCKINDQLKDTDMCEGDKCGVEVQSCQRYGPWPNTFMEFHTHPKGSGIIPSAHDIYGSISSHTDFICMGTQYQKGCIRCYAINKESPELKKFVDAFKSGDRMKIIELYVGWDSNGIINISQPTKEWKNFL